MKKLSFTCLFCTLVLWTYQTIAGPLPPGIAGAGSAATGETKTYVSTYSASCPDWAVSSEGEIVSEDGFSVEIRWITAGAGTVYFQDGCGESYGTKEVTVSGYPCYPAQPDVTFTVSTNTCGDKTITYSGDSPVTGTTWYWQTTSSGTSTDHPENPITISSSGTYYLIGKSHCNDWGPYKATSSITVNPIPSAAIPTAGYHCGTGIVNLSATPGANGNTVRWYSASSGGTLLETSTTFATSSLSSTTNYYVSTYNSTTGCESSVSSTPVTASIYTPPGAPSFTTAIEDHPDDPDSTTVSLCSGSNILQADPGLGGTTIYWYSGSSGGSPLSMDTTLTVTISTDTIFYITTHATNGCESSPRIAITININNDPCMNWTQTIVYDRDSSIVSNERIYQNGFGTNIQSQSVDVVSEKIWVQQPIFDRLNNPAGQTLPAPILSEVFAYKADFVQNGSGQAYSFLDFDKPISTGAAGEVLNPNPVGMNAGTLGWYYSASNDLEPTVAVTEFPYSRIYVPEGPDPTTSKSASAGENNKMGSGHEVIVEKTEFIKYAIDNYLDVKHFFVTDPIYDADPYLGYLVEATNPDGKIVTSYTDADGKELVKMTDGKWNYNFYNDMGQLMASVSPNGIDTGSPSKPGFVTYYKYNHVGALIETTSPDEGTTRFVYSTDGKLRFSENEVQRNATPQRFSYTNYDYLGRLVESGEYEVSGENPFVFESDTTQAPDTYSVLSIVDNTGFTGVTGHEGDTRCKETSFIDYDSQLDDYPPDALHVSQDNMTGQVARTKNDNTTTWYSYDEFGQLAWTKQALSFAKERPTKITWTNLVNTTVTNDTLRRPSGGFAWDAGAFSVQSIPANTDGWLEFTAGQTGAQKMVGLSLTDDDADYTSIDYAFYMSSGSMAVYENGTEHNIGIAFTTGDFLRIERVGSTILYKKNGAILYTSSVPSSGALHADCSMAVAPASIMNATITLALAPPSVTWTDMVNTSAGSNGIVKNTGSEGWNAGAFSVESIPANTDGWLEFTIAWQYFKIMGLSTTNADASYSSIGYAIYANESDIYVEENGTLRYPDPAVTFTTSDVFRIERTGTTIVYKKNGVVFYTSTVPSSGALHADCSIYLASASFWNISISSSLANAKIIDYDYDYFGNVTRVSYQKAQPDAFYHHYQYDMNQRLVSAYTSLNGSDSTLRAKYYYYLHGPLKRVELGGTAQGIDYVYNTDGSLKFINHPDSLTSKDPGLDGYSGPHSGFMPDIFGMAMDYNATDYEGAGYDGGSFTLSGSYPDQYGGAVKAIRWHSFVDSHWKRGYAFNYDDTNQLTSAKWGTVSGTGSYTIDLPAGNPYREAVTGYDKNGNIQSLVRKNKAEGDLADYDYVYTEGTNKLETLKNADTTMVEYQYNAIGQLVQQTEGANAMKVTYTAYGLTKEIFDGSDKIRASYAYDDRGNRVRKVTYTIDGSVDNVTYYVSDAAGNALAIYERKVSAGGLQELAEVPVYGSGRVGMYKPLIETYFYEVADHLGNVRGVIGAPTTDADTATYETAHAVKDQEKFLRYDNARRIYSTLLDRTNGSSPGYSERLSGGTNERYGLARSLSVMPGDTVRMKVYGKYLDPDQGNWEGVVLPGLYDDIINQVGGVVVDGVNHATSTSSFPFPGLFVPEDSLGDAPKAYLTWLFFDRNFVFVDGGFDRMTTDAMEVGLDTEHDSLSMEKVITEPGYLYIYLSNEETTPFEVYFDDFNVTHIHSNIVAGADYYPFGMAMTEREITKEDYRFGYQGQFAEKDKETAWNAFELRMYDARVGRWTSPDPEGQFSSPYLGMGNNPVSGVDPDGALFGLSTPWSQIVGGTLGFAAGAYIASQIGDGQNWWLGGLIGGIGGLALGEGTAGNKIDKSGSDTKSITGGKVHTNQTRKKVNLDHARSVTVTSQDTDEILSKDIVWTPESGPISEVRKGTANIKNLKKNYIYDMLVYSATGAGRVFGAGGGRSIHDFDNKKSKWRVPEGSTALKIVVEGEPKRNNLEHWRTRYGGEEHPRPGQAELGFVGKGPVVKKKIWKHGLFGFRVHLRKNKWKRR